MKQVSNILRLVQALDHLLKSQMREFAYSQGLNVRQLECLLYLARCNRYSNTPLGLTEYLKLTKGTVSQTLISLERKKLIRKTGHEHDKRVVHIHLLPKAKNILNSFEKKSLLHRSIHNNPEAGDLLEENLRNFLIVLQRENNSKTFGVCHTCTYFIKNGLGKSHQCGLTKEPLDVEDSTLLCREHGEGEKV